MRLHSVCPSCNCHSPIQTWLHANLIPADPRQAIATRKIWLAWMTSDDPTVSPTYRQRYFTRVLAATPTPDGPTYTVIGGWLYGWTLSSPAEAST